MQAHSARAAAKRLLQNLQGGGGCVLAAFGVGRGVECSDLVHIIDVEGDRDPETHFFSCPSSEFHPGSCSKSKWLAYNSVACISAPQTVFPLRAMIKCNGLAPLIEPILRIGVFSLVWAQTGVTTCHQNEGRRFDARKEQKQKLSRQWKHSPRQLRKGGHIGAKTVWPPHHKVQTERSTEGRERRQAHQREREQEEQ
eukprot:742723-Pelagomonas_calceolata.AAC.3